MAFKLPFRQPAPEIPRRAAEQIQRNFSEVETSLALAEALIAAEAAYAFALATISALEAAVADHESRIAALEAIVL